ncbi:hypothetical protein AHAS_Ahas16G0061200 [Arachis hypogaea]
MTHDAVEWQDENFASKAGRHRTPMKLGGWDTTAEMVALPNRVEEIQEGRAVIQSEILNEWSNGFLNLKIATARSADFSPRKEMADLAVDTSERTQSWDYDKDRVLAVGEVTSKVQVGLSANGAGDKCNRPRAQMGLPKEIEDGLDPNTQGPYAETNAGLGLCLTNGSEMEQNGGNEKGRSRSGRVGESDAQEMCCVDSVRDLGSAGVLIVGRRREACITLGSENAAHPYGTGGWPLMLEGVGAMAAPAVGGQAPSVSRPGGGGVRMGSLGLLTCTSGRKSRRVGMGIDRTRTGEQEQGNGSGGVDARGTLEMDGGLVAILSGGKTESAVACAGTSAGCHTAMTCSQMEGDGISLGDPRVELTLNRGRLGER